MHILPYKKLVEGRPAPINLHRVKQFQRLSANSSGFVEADLLPANAFDPFQPWLPDRRPEKPRAVVCTGSPEL
jgi:hypothetical protein